MNVLRTYRSAGTIRSAQAVSAQGGFGLIELMISLAVASFLVLGLVVMAGNTQRTYSTQTDLAGVGDKERFAMEVFGNAIETAGYFTIAAPITAVPSVNNALVASATGGATYVAGQSMAGTSGPPDTFNVRFQSANDPNSPSNCQGGTVAATATHTYESVFSIVNGNLVCAVGIDNGAPGAAVVLIDGVSNMSILYGVDTLGDVASTNEYVPASTVNANNWWGKVRVVKITLTFASTANLPPVSFTQSIQVMHGYSH
ncbi:MAG: PilW family protein [Burkholderiaceae bacterium]|nr:PilW family protein [Burkholderiaceae bacterium]